MLRPHDLSSVDAAPLLCAGLTTFSALRNAPAKAGDLVAVLGIGGLGHLGLQFDHLSPPYTKEKNEALKIWFEY